MKQSDYERWKQIRSMGLSRFVVVHGLLRFGLAMTVFLVFFARFSSGEFLTALLPLHVGIGLISGLLFGFLVWSANEASYQRRVQIGEDT